MYYNSKLVLFTAADLCASVRRSTSAGVSIFFNYRGDTRCRPLGKQLNYDKTLLYTSIQYT